MKLSIHLTLLAPSAVAIMLLLPCNGCGHTGFDLQAVSGTVSLDSQPLDSGSIQFCPMERNGLTSGASIVNGEYHIPREKGLPPQKYTVRISSADQTNVSQSQPVAIGADPPPGKERLPAKYNSQSELSVEVKPGGGNTFDFDLSSK